MLLFALGLPACSKTPSEDTPAALAGAGMTQVQRGEYLVTIAGCNDCHTPGTLYGAPDFKRALSGSELGWEGPFGVAYASNITPDMETGIGSWTDAEIERALRSGIRKDGSPVAPPMPWPAYARMAPEDMAAVIAYLRSIPAVPHKNPARIPPGQAATGAVIRMPPPPAWDAPRPETAAKH
jgi:mono/diheme cytochrome c family protein